MKLPRFSAEIGRNHLLFSIGSESLTWWLDFGCSRRPKSLRSIIGKGSLTTWSNFSGSRTQISLFSIIIVSSLPIWRGRLTSWLKFACSTQDSLSSIIFVFRFICRLKTLTTYSGLNFPVMEYFKTFLTQCNLGDGPTAVRVHFCLWKVTIRFSLHLGEGRHSKIKCATKLQNSEAHILKNSTVGQIFKFLHHNHIAKDFLRKIYKKKAVTRTSLGSRNTPLKSVWDVSAVYEISSAQI